MTRAEGPSRIEALDSKFVRLIGELPDQVSQKDFLPKPCAFQTARLLGRLLRFSIHWIRSDGEEIESERSSKFRCNRSLGNRSDWFPTDDTACLSIP